VNQPARDQLQIAYAARTIALQMQEEHGRARCSGGGARVDVALELLLQSVLFPSPGTTDNFFQADRPLGSFGARITLAARMGLVDQPVEQALQTLRRVRNGFAHSTTAATLTDPSHAERLQQTYAAARSNSLWLRLERILHEKVGSDGSPLDPALRDYILLITILGAFLETAARLLSPIRPTLSLSFEEGISRTSKTSQSSNRLPS
jgi:hypothetical protein